jgi:hypothetical protein
MTEPSREDKIASACQWYRSNKAIIQAMLPLRVPLPDCPRGFSLYPANWDPEFWITRWEEKRLPLDEAEILISGQLRPLFPVVRDRMGANQG